MICAYCKQEIKNEYKEITYAKEKDFNSNNVNIKTCCISCEDEYKKELRNGFTQTYDDKLQELKKIYTNITQKDRRRGNKKTNESRKKLNKSKKYKLHKIEKFYIITSNIKESVNDGI